MVSKNCQDPNNPHQQAILDRKKKRLNVLEEALEMVVTHYGGIRWFTGIVQQAGRLVQAWVIDRDAVDPTQIDEKSFPAPEAFLRLVMTLDKSLSTAGYPDDGDLPVIPGDMLQQALPLGPDSYAASVNPADAVSWSELLSFLEEDPLTRPYSKNAGGDTGPGVNSYAPLSNDMELDGFEPLDPLGLENATISQDCEDVLGLDARSYQTTEDWLFQVGMGSDLALPELEAT